jgi:hypothetical protein
LIRIEKRLDSAEHIEFDELENLLKVISTSVNPPIAKTSVLLGDVYRNRFYKYETENLDLLKTAKIYYQKALNIQPTLNYCTDIIESINKQIELITFITTGNYRSIPSLIRIIGEDLTDKSYTLLRGYLLDIVDSLVTQQDYLHAVALLAAIQIHDKSEEVTELVTRILNLAPDTYLDTLLDTQQYVLELEQYVLVLETVQQDLNIKIRDKDTFIADMQAKYDATISENKKLEQTLSSILEQLESVRAMRDQMKELAERGVVLKDEIAGARMASGRGVVVNFGFGLGWAIYQALHGEYPFIKRNGNKIFVTNGLVLTDDDRVHNSDGTEVVWLIPPWAKITLE